MKLGSNQELRDLTDADWHEKTSTQVGVLTIPIWEFPTNKEAYITISLFYVIVRQLYKGATTFFGLLRLHIVKGPTGV